MTDDETTGEEETTTPAPEETTAAAGDVLPQTREELDALLAARDAEAQERQLRLAAEYQNFRRRVEREREVWGDEAVESFARDLLPVLDSFDRALAVREQDPVAAASGIEAVDRQIKTALEKHGMSVVDPAGKPFDPRYHEAILRTPSADLPPGTVTAVLEKGWLLGTRLLRAARVQVSAPPEGK